MNELRGTFFEYSGYRFFYHNNGSKITNIRIIVNTGFADDYPNSHGIAHCLEHMLFKGTEKHTWKQINNSIAELGEINAYTDIDETVYHITCLSENFKKAFDLLCEIFFTPNMSESEFEKEKNVILEEISTRENNYSTHYFDKVFERFLGNKVGHCGCGTIDSVKNLTLEGLLKFREQLYAMDNILISITGDVNIDDIKRVFSNHPTDLLANSKQKITALIPEYTKGYFEVENTSNQSIMSMVFKSVPGRYQFNTFVPEIFSEGFGTGMHSILWERIREKLGLAYDVGTNFFVHRNNVSFIYVYAFLEHSNVDTARDEVEKLLIKVKNKGFSKKLLKICKSSFLFHIACQLNDTVRSNSRLDNYFLDGYRPRTYDDIVETISKISNEDIIEYANNVFNIDKMCFIRLVKCS